MDKPDSIAIAEIDYRTQTILALVLGVIIIVSFMFGWIVFSGG